MEPVGLNVGSWYLAELREQDWLADTAYAWAVRVNTTGESIGEVTLARSGEITVEAATDIDATCDGLRTARDAVDRFRAAQPMGLDPS